MAFFWFFLLQYCYRIAFCYNTPQYCVLTTELRRLQSTLEKTEITL